MANEFGNYATLNPIIFDTGTTSYSEGNLRILNSATTATSTPVTISLPNRQGDNGLYYAECRINAQGNDTTYLGAADAGWVGWQLGDNQLGYIAGTLGIRLGNDFKFQTYSNNSAGTLSDIVGVVGDHFRIAFDTNTGKTWVGFWDVSADAGYWLDNDGTKRTSDEPGSGTNENYTFPATIKNLLFGVSPRQYQSNNGDMTLKIDSVSWLAATPSGAVALGTQNQTTPAILNPDDHYYNVLLDHDGSSTATTCTFNLDTNAWLAIIKSTSEEKWFWVDNLRGVTNYMSSDSTAGETADSNVMSVSGTTLTLGSTLADANYLIEVHKAGALPTANNTEAAGATPTAGSVKIDGSNLGSALAGSIAATRLSSNTTSGFSIILMTGTEENATVAHGLSKAPEWVIHKERDSGGNNWATWHIGIANTTFIPLDTSVTLQTEATKWNSTSPTATTYSLGTDTGNNEDDATYVTYCWHGVEGYSKFGTYETNASTNGPFINTNFHPSSVFIRHFDEAGSWYQLYSAQNDGNPQDLYYSWDIITAQPSAFTFFDWVSNGIKFRTAGGSVNDDGGTVAYGAIGGRPMTDGAVNQGRAGAVKPFGQAYGGTISVFNNSFVHVFTASGTFTPTISGSVDFLVIAGGGAGSSQYGGGGGAGGYRNSFSSETSGGGGSSETALSLTAGTTYTVTVGAGGTGASGQDGNNGANSVFATITSIGGGGGGQIGNDGKAGGSGGGGGGDDRAGATFGTGTANQGFNGGAGDYDSNANNGGGGGGSGAVGVDGDATDAGSGGNGLASSITGASVTRAGGGGGGAYATGGGVAGAAGSGNAGAGANANSSTAGSATANTGSGGGGAGSGGTSGAGGSGIVIVRYTP